MYNLLMVFEPKLNFYFENFFSPVTFKIVNTAAMHIKSTFIFLYKTKDKMGYEIIFEFVSYSVNPYVSMKWRKPFFLKSRIF